MLFKQIDFPARRESDHDWLVRWTEILNLTEANQKSRENETRSFVTPYAPVVLTLRGPRAAITLG